MTTFGRKNYTFNYSTVKLASGNRIDCSFHPKVLKGSATFLDFDHYYEEGSRKRKLCARTTQEVAISHSDKLARTKSTSRRSQKSRKLTPKKTRFQVKNIRSNQKNFSGYLAEDQLFIIRFDTSDFTDWEWTVGGFPIRDVGRERVITDLNNYLPHPNNEQTLRDNQNNRVCRFRMELRGTIKGMPVKHNTSSHSKSHWTRFPRTNCTAFTIRLL